MTEEGTHWEAAEEAAELLREGRADAAIPLLEALIVEQPENEYAFFFLGAAHFELEHFDKAMKAYVRTLEIAPEYIGAMLNLAHTLRLLGRHREAIALGQQVLGRRKEDPDALYLLGLLHYARGEGERARDYLERFVATGPEAEAAQEVQGLLQMLRGEVEPLEIS